MNLQDKLVALAEYNIGFNVYEGNFLVNITYKNEWSIIQPADKGIKFMKDKETANVYYYSTPISDPEALQHVFDTIDETITYNKELEAKVVLFKLKMAELQQIFTEKPLSELQNMEFTFKTVKPKAKTSKKTTKKKTEKTSTEDCNEEKQADTVVSEKTSKNNIETSSIDDKITASIEKMGFNEAVV